MRSKISLSQTMGVVLVGTHPWANSAFDQLLPRTLLPVAHRPLLSYALSWLDRGGIDRAAVCANRETQLVRSRLQNHVPSGMCVSYHQDAMPRGAAGALRDAALATGCESFVVTDGTSIPSVDLQDLMEHHFDSRAAVTMLVHPELQRHGNRSAQAPTGVYVCNRDALEAIPERGFYDLKENLIPDLYRAGKEIRAFAATAASPRVHDATSYLAVNEWMVEHLVACGETPDGYVRSGGCLRHRDAVISDDAEFVGPVIVGPGARIGSRAVVVGPTSIGLEVSVGAGALISRSAVWRRSVIGDRAVADRCILADDTVISQNTQAFRAVVLAGFNHERPERRAIGITAREPLSLEPLKRARRFAAGTS